jgi:hypothetical protein
VPPALANVTRPALQFACLSCHHRSISSGERGRRDDGLFDGSGDSE